MTVLDRLLGRPPKLTQEHRRIATVLLQGGEVCCYRDKVRILDDLAAHGLKTVRPNELARIANEDMREFALAYARLFGDPCSFVGSEDDYRAWCRGHGYIAPQPADDEPERDGVRRLR